jgi:transcriptional regulator with PAS, ATPase and Fis domain
VNPACDGVSAREAGWAAVSAAFGSLGRVFITLDAEFRIRHASQDAERLTGRPIEDVLGAELFGPDGALRRAAIAGERREGWRGMFQSHLVSVTVAPLVHDAAGVCDPEVKYIVVLRPAEEDFDSSGPTAFGGVIARSRAMGEVLRLIANLEHSDATVLVTGESGTGKEVIARAIHRHSLRRDGPFVAVNCGAIPGELLESELFGHVRGAFTGAVKDRVGRFEAAEHGTLFLDEISEMPPHLQVKLLRVLQEHTYERVGESHERRSDARIIAASNADLRHAVELGQFREDLYYRLRVVPIELPPLRQRPEDVEPLAQFLLSRTASRNGRVLKLSPEAMRALLSHSWPGNVRELENALEYATAVCKRHTIFPEDLPPTVGVQAPAPAPRTELGVDALRCVLQENRWNRAAAARALGVSRTTLWRRMREHGLMA